MKNKLTIIFFLLFVLACGVAGYYYYHFKQAANAATTTETADITQYLSQFVLLPSETPTLAVVTDTTKLTNPALAEKAQDNDRILLYTNAGMAILYRPSTRKLIDMYPVSTATPTPTPTPTVSPTPRR